MLCYLPTILLGFLTTFCEAVDFPCSVDGDIRLTYRTELADPHKGKIEVCNGVEWGTVCDSDFGLVDASVVCRNLGYSKHGAQIMDRIYWPDGYKRYYSNFVNCDGTEERFVDCDMERPGTRCDHRDDTGVICQHLICEDGDIRLVDGNETLGFVEVCMDEEWHTVCLDSWRMSNTEVFCRQLGYETINGLESVLSIPGENGSLYEMNFECEGNEKQVLDCDRHAVSSNESCTAVTLQCSTTRLCSSGEVRLAGGSNDSSGVVEVCVDKEWEGVCGETWTETEARVVCLQLGFSRLKPQAQTPATYAVFSTIRGAIVQAEGYSSDSKSDSIFIYNVSCSGSESNLFSCHHDTGIANCTDRQAARVICLPKFCENNEIRLAGGPSPNEGRLEMCYEEVWGTVCSNGLSSTLTKSVCSELGFENNYATRLIDNLYLAPEEGPIHNIQCNDGGNDVDFVNCSSGPNQQHCNHYQDVNIKCDQCSGNSVALTEADKGNMRVEVCYNGTWWALCPDTWDDKAAGVLCQQQHLDREGTQQLAVNNIFFSLTPLPVLANRVQCDGNEASIADCKQDYSGIDCSSNKVAGINCRVDPPSPIVEEVEERPTEQSLLKVVILPATISALVVIVLAIVIVVACIVGVKIRNRKAIVRLREPNAYNPVAIGDRGVEGVGENNDCKEIYDLPDEYGIYEKIGEPTPTNTDSMELNPYYTTTFKPRPPAPPIPPSDTSMDMPANGNDVYDYIDAEKVLKSEEGNAPYDLPPPEMTTSHHEPLRVVGPSQINVILGNGLQVYNSVPEELKSDGAYDLPPPEITTSHYEPLRAVEPPSSSQGLYTVVQTSASSAEKDLDTAQSCGNYQELIINEKERDSEYADLNV